MDFGDILRQWDGVGAARDRPLAKKSAQKGHHSARKRASPAPSSDSAASRVRDEFAAYLDAHDIPDKDSAHAVEAARHEENRRLLRKKPDRELDLHEKTRTEALRLLDAFFDRAARCGWEKVLIIHGKGNHSAGEAVLAKTVRSFLEQCPYAGRSGHNSGNEGGAGATWVLVKTG